MKVQGVGELTDHDTYWRLTYDECGHAQEFPREGLDEPEGAAFFVRRHYTFCLTCAVANTPTAAVTPNVEPDQFHLVLSHDELAAIVTALRSSDRPELADRLDKVLRHLG
jgi:hypothetical protein